MIDALVNNIVRSAGHLRGIIYRLRRLDGHHVMFATVHDALPHDKMVTVVSVEHDIWPWQGTTAPTRAVGHPVISEEPYSTSTSSPRMCPILGTYRGKGDVCCLRSSKMPNHFSRHQSRMQRTEHSYFCLKHRGLFWTLNPPFPPLLGCTGSGDVHWRSSLRRCRTRVLRPASHECGFPRHCCTRLTGMCGTNLPQRVAAIEWPAS